MASLIRRCKGCGSSEGTIKHINTPHYYWRHMEFPQCPMMWHVCTFHLQTWDWEDAHLPSRHFENVIHPSPKPPTLCDPLTLHTNSTLPPPVVNHTNGGMRHEMEEVSYTEGIVIEDLLDPHDTNAKTE